MLTFAFDVQLNDNEDYIKAGTKVRIYDHPIKKSDCTPVIIDKAWTYEGKEFTPDCITYEWFMNSSFIESN